METVKCSFFYEGEEYEFEMRNRISFNELIFGSTICDEIRSIAGEQIDRQIEEYIDKLEQRELNKTRLDMLIDEIIGDPSVTAALKQVADTLSATQQDDEEKTE